ncbi:hypothetical protein LguiA_031087 [Lonicera macranthoides]
MTSHYTYTSGDVTYHTAINDMKRLEVEDVSHMVNFVQNLDGVNIRSNPGASILPILTYGLSCFDRRLIGMLT